MKAGSGGCVTGQSERPPPVALVSGTNAGKAVGVGGGGVGGIAVGTLIAMALSDTPHAVTNSARIAMTI
jgi:hypothetical protein